MNWLRSPHLIALILLLAGLGAATYAFGDREFRPEWKPLAELPKQSGSWLAVRDSPMDKEVLDELKADDTLVRDYAGPRNEQANLYIAFFRSQRTGVTPHSPKHCLPANGYVPASSAIVDLNPPGAPAPIPVNRYIVSRGENRSLVYYWYQSPHRAVASEYLAKLYLVIDSLRYRRSDTSLVRIVVPIVTTEEQAEKAALDFLYSIYGPLKGHLPG